VAALLVSAPVRAELTKQQYDWLYDFAGIAGTWWVNQECHHLSIAERKEFKFHVGEITESLAAME